MGVSVGVGVCKYVGVLRLGKFSLRLIGSAMFGATFNLITRV